MSSTVLIFFLGVFTGMAHGHGLMIDPPPRNAMWREGFPNPINWNDNGLNCGGMGYQWYEHGGKCGVCGDPVAGARKHEAGYPGGFANGIIVREYRRGSVIQAKARITANHLGYISFKICPVNDKTKKVTQQCLDRYPLRDRYGREKFNIVEYIGNRAGEITVDLQLPPNLTCTQCVVQWKYTSGIMTGGRIQETFQNCADVTVQ